MHRYEKLLKWILQGKRPAIALVSLFILFPVSLMLLIAEEINQLFFQVAILILFMCI
jgi:multidrug efflux pump